MGWVRPSNGGGGILAPINDIYSHADSEIGRKPVAMGQRGRVCVFQGVLLRSIWCV